MRAGGKDDKNAGCNSYKKKNALKPNRKMKTGCLSLRCSCICVFLMSPTSLSLAMLVEFRMEHGLLLVMDAHILTHISFLMQIKYCRKKRKVSVFKCCLCVVSYFYRPDQQVRDQWAAMLAHHSRPLVRKRPVFPLVLSHHHLRQLDPPDVVRQHTGIRRVHLRLRKSLPVPHQR